MDLSQRRKFQAAPPVRWSGLLPLRRAVILVVGSAGVRKHFAEHIVSGLVFLTLALFQLNFAFLLALRPGPAAYRVGRWGSWTDRAGLHRNTAFPIGGSRHTRGNQHDRHGSYRSVTGYCCAARSCSARARSQEDTAWRTRCVGSGRGAGVRTALVASHRRRTMDGHGLRHAALLGWHRLLVGAHADPSWLAAPASLDRCPLVEPARCGGHHGPGGSQSLALHPHAERRGGEKRRGSQGVAFGAARWDRRSGVL
jgi:hypothetical protein